MAQVLGDIPRPGPPRGRQIAEEQAPGVAEANGMFIANQEDMRILIVDDDKLIRWALQEICARDGHDVITVCDSDRALQEIQCAPFDLVFADLDMEEADAPALIREIHGRQPQASFILVSSRPDQESDSLLHEIKISRVIEKPFEASKIRSLLDAVGGTATAQKTTGPAGETLPGPKV